MHVPRSLPGPSQVPPRSLPGPSLVPPRSLPGPSQADHHVGRGSTVPLTTPRQWSRQVPQTCLSAIRNFHLWMEPLDRTVWNCWGTREKVEAPHAFTYKLGRDLGPSERAWLGESRCPESRCQGVADNDVYCCVKTYMRDTSLQQAPAVVLPAGRDERLVEEPRAVCNRHPMGKKKMDNYVKLAQKLKEHGLGRAAEAMHALVFDLTYSVPPLPWLRSGWQVDRAERGDQGNFFFHHLPASSWRLFAGDMSSGGKKRKRSTPAGEV